jgi:hypothetical protein
VTFGKKLGKGVSIRGRGTFMRLLQEKRSSSYAFNELIVQRPALSQLVYMFVLDNALVAYVPASGNTHTHTQHTHNTHTTHTQHTQHTHTHTHTHNTQSHTRTMLMRVVL